METFRLLHNHTPAPAFTLTDAEGWFDALRAGEFQNRQGADGAAVHFLQVITPADLAAVVDRWEKEGRPDILIDRDHLSYNTDNDTRAKGWVQDLRVEGDVLQCRARWSREGLEDLTAGVYRKCSASINTRDEPGQPDDAGKSPDKPRRVRPVRLDSVALTNRPNIPGLRVLSNRAAAAPPNPVPDQTTQDTVTHMDTKILAAALGLPSTATEADISAALTLNKNRADAAAGELADTDLERFKDVIPDGAKAFYRTQLLTNRAETVKALEAQDAAMKAARPDQEEEDAGQGAAATVPGFATTRLHNRATATAKPVPGAISGAGADARGQALTGRALQFAQQDALTVVKNRAPHLTSLAALETAKRENPNLFPAAV